MNMKKIIELCDEAQDNLEALESMGQCFIFGDVTMKKLINKLDHVCDETEHIRAVAALMESSRGLSAEDINRVGALISALAGQTDLIVKKLIAIKQV